MTQYRFTLVGTPDGDIDIECAHLAEARDAAIRHLGQYLTEHPEFGRDGHWQLNVNNDLGQELMHVIVAAVVPRSSPLYGSGLEDEQN